MKTDIKVSIKNFLKPTIEKIVLMVVLVVMNVGYFTASSINYSNPIYWIIALPVQFFITTKFYTINAIVIGAMILVLQIIYLYLLPCLIIYLFDKLRRRSK